MVLIPAVFALGSMVGPGMAAWLVAGGRHAPLLWLAPVTSAVPAFAYSIARRGPAGAGEGSARGAG